MLSLILSIFIAQPVCAQISLSVAQQYLAEQRYKEAISLLEGILKDSDINDPNLLQFHLYLATAYRHTGLLAQAAQQWQQALSLSSSSEQTAKILIDQAQVYIALGNISQASEKLYQALKISRNPPTITVAYGALGNALSLSGDYTESINAYSQVLTLSTTVPQRLTALINLSQTLARRGQKLSQQALLEAQAGILQNQKLLSDSAEKDILAARQKALEALRESQSRADLLRLQVLLNWLAIDQSDPDTELLREALNIVPKLSPSRSSATSLIQLSDYLQSRESIPLLERAIALGQSLNDLHTLSFAQGSLAQVYETQGNYEPALALYRQAQLTAQQVNAPESLYLWQWKAGRLLNLLGRESEATASYQQALSNLQNLRQELLDLPQSLQLDVKEEVEPIYRELLALLLKQGNLKETIRVSKLLKLSELQSFFQDLCSTLIQGGVQQQTPQNSNTAIIYSIILERQTYLLLQLPNGRLRSYRVSLNTPQLKHQIEKFRSQLEHIASDEYLRISKLLYEQLISPLKADLANPSIDTLIFINDGILRNVPMAALHDGQQFLVEKYAIAYSLGLKFKPQPTPQAKSVLLFGMTESVASFPTLPYVRNELNSIQASIGGDIFLDQDFNSLNFSQQLQAKNYRIIHIATHGRFSGSVHSSFLQASDQPISLLKLEQLLRQSHPIELLTLSACQTAAGNNRSTLGFAGVALRTGVQNVLATLWSINDNETVTLMNDFYQFLIEPGMTYSEALRQTQLKSINNSLHHPAVWSSFILVVN